jgi:hypothetical protein
VRGFFLCGNERVSSSCKNLTLKAEVKKGNIFFALGSPLPNENIPLAMRIAALFLFCISQPVKNNQKYFLCSPPSVDKFAAIDFFCILFVVSVSAFFFVLTVFLDDIITGNDCPLCTFLTTYDTPYFAQM